MTKASSIFTNFQRRKTSKQLPYRFRYKAISSHDQVEARKWRKYFLFFVILSFINKSFKNTFVLPAIKYFSLILEDRDAYEEDEKPPRKVVTIDSFSFSTCKLFFNFQRADLQHLLELFNFPDTVHFKNKGKMSGEEVFLRGLYELVTGENQERMCRSVFGREYSQHSRAFSWFIDHMYNNYKHLVTDSLPWWHRNGFTKTSADAIWDKMLSTGYQPTVEEVEQMRAGYFIDCKCSPTSVVGGGPAEDGANAARWDVEVNRAFYNGWKSVHGLKHQTGCTRTCMSCIQLLCILIYIDFFRISTLRINVHGVNSRNFFCSWQCIWHHCWHLRSHVPPQERPASTKGQRYQWSVGPPSDRRRSTVRHFWWQRLPQAHSSRVLPRSLSRMVQCYEEGPHIYRVELCYDWSFIQVHCSAMETKAHEKRQRC